MSRHAVLVNYERMWERLIAALDDWTSAREVEPGRIEVALPDSRASSRSVQIVMTPDQWDDMAGTVFGGFDHALGYVIETLQEMREPDAFAVFSTYDLVASTVPELPTDPHLERLNDLARGHPEGIGGWFTYGGDATVRHEYRPEQEEP